MATGNGGPLAVDVNENQAEGKGPGNPETQAHGSRGKALLLAGAGGAPGAGGSGVPGGQTRPPGAGGSGSPGTGGVGSPGTGVSGVPGTGVSGVPGTGGGGSPGAGGGWAPGTGGGGSPGPGGGGSPGPGGGGSPGPGDGGFPGPGGGGSPGPGGGGAPGGRTRPPGAANGRSASRQRLEREPPTVEARAPNGRSASPQRSEREPLDPEAEESRLSGRLADSCVITGDLNGCCGPPGREEPPLVGGEEGEEGGGVLGPGPASCPAGLRGQDPRTRDCVGPGCPPERPPCPGKGRRSSAGTIANGGHGPTGAPDPEGDCEEVKVPNGGLHFVAGEGSTDSDSEPEPGLGDSSRDSPGPWPRSGLVPLHGDQDGDFPGPWPLPSDQDRDSPGPWPLPRDQDGESPGPWLPSKDQDRDSPGPREQDRASPGPWPPPGDQDGAPPGPRPPSRPRTLRTGPALPGSLSCDATPLSPGPDGGLYLEEDGGLYLEEGGLYPEDGGCGGGLRAAVEAGRRQSAPDQLSQQPHGAELKLMPKRFGIADFFTRSLFSRKSKEPKAASGWRLFSRTPSGGEGPGASPAPPQGPGPEEAKDGDPQRPPLAARRKNLEFEPLSTTALILEDRPPNLPAKSEEEALRHRLEYEEMVAGAKRREQREAQRKRRQMKERHRQEDSISSAMVVWNSQILPHWEAMRGTRRVRELWWQGLPPSVRGRVWSLAIGNELNITAELYEIFLSRAKEKWRSYSETSSVADSESDGASLADRESSLDLIKLDISRTFPSLFIFQKGGPYHDLLHSVLGAYTCYRPDIGYVQGMSFIAAVLILNLEEAEAFVTFANLLNKPCQMAFFRVDHDLMLKYFAAFEVFFEENLPRLFSHFQTNGLTPDLYLIDWIFTLYSRSLPLDVACRVWDVFCRDGEQVLFRAGLALLRLYQRPLLQMDFIRTAQFLTRLPGELPADALFSAMAATSMTSQGRRWSQVFSSLMKDGGKEVEKNSSPALRS